MTEAKKVETLIARQEIADVVYSYARGIDRFDFELVRSCYHPDAYDDHGAFRGNVDEFIAAAKDFLPRWTATQHFMGNMLIEVDGDTARAETYAVAYHRLDDKAGNGKDDIMGIRYVDRFEKRQGEWKIAHRVVCNEWRRVDPVAGARGRDKIGVWGRRDDGDVVNWILSASAPEGA
jgi:ketosteroid isomerase-like protein